MSENAAIGNRDKLIMYNARRLMKKKYKQMPNWALYVQLFGTGSMTAHKRCRDIGLDPDATGERA